MPHCIHILKSAEAECTGMLHIVLELAQHTAALGWPAAILFLGSGPLEAVARAAGVPCDVVPWDGTRRDPPGALRVWKWMRQHPAEVVHVHHGGLAVRAVCRLAGAQAVVQHIHSCILENANGASVEQLRFRAADAVIASSQAAASRLRNCRPEVIYAGIDAPSQPPAPAPFTSEFRIGMLTRLVPLKNVEMVIATVSRLRQQGIAVSLEIAGEGPLLPELHEFASRSGVAEHVCFLGWQSDVRALLVRWHLLVISSNEESFPVSALEAMACARPVLATRVGGLPEMIVDGVTGRLVPAGDEVAMAEALAELAANPERAAQMGRVGWQRASELFSPMTMARQTTQLYDRLLRRTHGLR